MYAIVQSAFCVFGIIALNTQQSVNNNYFWRQGASGSGMSTMARLEWNDQQAALDQKLKGFMAQPDAASMEAVIAQMRVYAEAAKNGAMEIPKTWTSYN